MVFGLGLNYLCSGDIWWVELMEDLVWYIIDIDIYYIDDDWFCYNYGMFWYIVYYVDVGCFMYCIYFKGICGGGLFLGYVYVCGLMFYYLMIGDVMVCEVVVKMGDWMIVFEDGLWIKYCLLVGGEMGLMSVSGIEDYYGLGWGLGNCVEVLMMVFELICDWKYID